MKELDCKELSYTELDYKVIASGSSGNAVRIENLMIDCGIPYKHLKDELYKCKYLFITHKHTDHLMIATYKKIRKEFPRVKVYANYDVANHLQQKGLTVDVITGIKDFQLSPDLNIETFEVPHNVYVQGFTMKYKDINVIYVTDSAGTKTWRKGKYDYLFIESNHDDEKLSQACAGRYADRTYKNSKRHTSTLESKAFYFMNRKSDKSKYIELHKSNRFY